jgi:hypothetical protein
VALLLAGLHAPILTPRARSAEVHPESPAAGSPLRPSARQPPRALPERRFHSAGAAPFTHASHDAATPVRFCAETSAPAVAGRERLTIWRHTIAPARSSWPRLGHPSSRRVHARPGWSMPSVIITTSKLLRAPSKSMAGARAPLAGATGERWISTPLMSPACAPTRDENGSREGSRPGRSFMNRDTHHASPPPPAAAVE